MALIRAERRLLASSWAVQIAGYAVVLIVAGIVLHRLFGLATPVALNLFLLAFAAAAVAVLFAVFALWRIWIGGHRGTGSALVAIALATGIFLWPLSLWPQMRALPEINDVTTDTERPPAFVEARKARPRGSNPVVYPGPRFAEQQKKAYPDLRTLAVERDAAETTTLVAQALRRLRMEVVREVPPDPRTGGAGSVEAVDRTLVFGFYDDVAVRVRSSGRGALVDVRSASRYGRHDFGSNAARVRTILTALVERIQATVPKTGAGRKGLRIKRPKAGGPRTN